jgi:YD repeat-containing protein
MKFLTLLMYLFLLSNTILANRPLLDSVPLSSSQNNTVTLSTDDYANRLISRMDRVSPNAAALGIFGAVPVGHYRGIPDISVPFYDLMLDNKKISIDLAYHASGIKVSQEASAVGLGWALKAGGCIVREIRGRDDFASSVPPKSYYYDTDFVHWNSNNDPDPNYYSQDRQQYASYINGGDSEPDLFHFNFASFSGTFFFDKVNATGNSSTTAKGVVRKNEEYLDITFQTSPSSQKIIIIDGYGFSYYFSPYESAITYLASKSDYDPNIPRSHFSRKNFDTEYTGWYLDSIISPSKKRIFFSYAMETVVSPVSTTEDVSYLVSSGGGSGSNMFQGSYMFYKYAYSESQQARLTKISFDEGYISFVYSDRLDLESLYQEKIKRLTAITLYNNDHEIIKNMNFLQSYLGSTNSPLTCRLMLDSIKISDHASRFSSYGFTYNRGILPEKNSPSCDYWGYYNGGIPGAGERSFKLSPTVYLQKENEVLSFPGLSKRTSPALSKYGLISEISYPTGGKTVFEFEPHDFEASIPEFNKRELSYTSLTIGDFNNWYTTGEKFTVKEKTKVDLEMIYWHTMPPSGYDYPYVEVRLYKEGNSNPLRYFQLRADESSYPDPLRSREGRDSEIQSLIMDEGKYYFVFNGAWMSNQGRDNQVVRAIVSGIATTNVSQGAGLRVKSITNYADDKIATKKDYIYRTENGSSGILITTPIHHSQYTLLSTKYTIMKTAIFVDNQNATYINGYSTPYIPFSGSAGSYVGYSYVKEKNVIDVDAEGNGSSVYTFINEPDGVANLQNRLIKGFPAISSQRNGMPLELYFFNKNNKLIQRKTFEYSKREGQRIKGLQVFQIPISLSPPPLVDEDPWTDIKFYDIINERWYLQRSSEYNYFDTSMSPLTEVTEFSYNDQNLSPNYVKFTNSKGQIVEKDIKYATDFISPVEIDMQNKHMINIPLQTVTSVNDNHSQKEISRRLLKYFKDPIRTKDLILPEKVQYSNSGAANLQTTIDFNQYDTHGNILEQQKANGVKEVYLWGYQSQYPVLKIIGSDLATVLNIATLDTAALNNGTPAQKQAQFTLIRNHFSTNPLVHISTYTYQPLVGITSETDPTGRTIYYEYDTFNRLKLQKDEQGNILKKYCYNYAGQPIDCN